MAADEPKIEEETTEEKKEEKPKVPEEFLGAAHGKYQWNDARTGGSADNQGAAITKYSWADGKKLVSVYVELDDLDAVPDDDIKITSESNSFQLIIKIGGKERKLEIKNLAEEVDGSKFTRKKGKNTVVAKLTKKEEKSWFKLQSGGGSGGGDDEED